MNQYDKKTKRLVVLWFEQANMPRIASDEMHITLFIKVTKYPVNSKPKTLVCNNRVCVCVWAKVRIRLLFCLLMEFSWEDTS